MVKALGLFSGGLDSILAAKLLVEQGIKVTGITFVTPFFGSQKAEKAAHTIGIELIIFNITEEYLEMLLNPRYGYGSYMNPCIDCHTLMLKVAGGIMKEKNFDFIFTGEVLGERPMSQNKMSLHVVAKNSGYKDYILRPLSAKLLPIIKPEEEGKIKREKFLDISGRQRKRQLEMAEKYGIKEPPTPGGGCLLTDPGFSARLKDLLVQNGKPRIEDIELLKIGRHIRLDKDTKIVIGRNKEDNERLTQIRNKKFVLYTPLGVRGPSCMVPRDIKESLIEKVAKICVSYSDAKEGENVTFKEKGVNPGKRMSAVYSRSNRPKELIGALAKKEA